MNAATRLVAFGLVLALAAGAGAVVGGAFGPAPSAPTVTHGRHDAP